MCMRKIVNIFIYVIRLWLIIYLDTMNEKMVF